MEFITENRYRLIKSLEEIEPRAIISYSTPNLPQLTDKPIRMIINTKQYDGKLAQKYPKWWIKTNNKIHGKLAIGLKGFIIGSWNFSNNSTQNFHKTVMALRYEDTPNIQKALKEYFDKMWDRSNTVR